MTGQEQGGAPPGDDAGAGANRPRDVERQLRGFDTSTVPLDPGDPGLIRVTQVAQELGGPR